MLPVAPECAVLLLTLMRAELPIAITQIQRCRFYLNSGIKQSTLLSLGVIAFRSMNLKSGDFKRF